MANMLQYARRRNIQTNIYNLTNIANNNKNAKTIQNNIKNSKTKMFNQ